MRRPRLWLLLLLATGAARAGLPPVPVPAENPLTEEKRILGKILFWDEQLSSDDTVACGTCHRPAAGGSDARAGRNPGREAGSFDDVAGSPGIRRLDESGQPVPDPVFGGEPQVTPRVAPSIFGALWSESLFWDGRAGGRFVDPGTNMVVIAAGGALENQALMALANPAEMAKTNRSWDELETKLARSRPLDLADRLPTDVAAALAARPTYPALFAAAFGDDEVSAARIAMAIASYERSLVPDQTPWDAFDAGDATALTQFERFGLEAMQTMQCTSCHAPPLFSTNEFANVGLRRSELDRGRQAVTNLAEDAGAMRIPSLRNVGLRPRLMHTGQFTSVADAIIFYRNPSALPDVDRLPGGGAYNFSITQLNASDIQSFLQRALTDPRAAAERFPFDRPRLASER
jgi:cytochrome c peroxidase